MKLKNIFGTLETGETTREHSRLFPEAPSSRALEIVARPEWQTAIAFRLNEALYGSNLKTLREIVLPRFPRTLPTYDSEINLHLFTEEEAVRLDRRATGLITEEEGFSRDDAYEYIVKDGPPDQERIRVDEQFRRVLLKLTDSIEKSEWGDCDIILMGIQDMIAKLKNDHHEQIASAFVRDVVDPLFGAHLKVATARHDAKKTLGMLRAIHTTRFAQLSHHGETIQMIARDAQLMESLARSLLERIGSPEYADQLRACGQYGLDIGALKERIRRQCVPELIAVLKSGDVEAFFRYCDFAVRQEIITEEELSQNGGIRAALLAYARSLIGDQDAFRTVLGHCAQSKLLDKNELTSSPVIQKAAEDLLVGKFEGGNNIEGLLNTASSLANLGIMHYDEALQHPAIVQMASDNLEKIFTANILTDDPHLQEKIYLDTVRKYVDAKIGARTFFDNLPAIKQAREEAGKMTI